MTRLAPLCLALSLVALACASSPAHPVGANDADSTPVPHVGGAGMMAARSEPAPPRPAAATLAVPAALVDGWIVALIPALPPMLPRILDELLGPGGSRILSSPSPLRELGIDTSGSGLLLLAAIDPAQEPVVQRLRGIAAAVAAGQSPTEGDLGSLEAIRSTAGPAEVRLRAVLPITDPDTLLRTIRALVRETRAGRELPSSPTFDVAWSIDDEAAVGLWHDSANLTMDVWFPLDRNRSHETFPTRALAALAAARSESIVPDPAATAGSGPSAVRLAIDPPAVARIAALHGEWMVQQAISNVAPEYRMQILGTGLAESCRTFDLIESPRGPVLQAIHAQARSGPGGLEGEIVGDLGPGYPQDVALWRPSPSLDFGSLPVAADLDLRFFRGFQFPGGGNDHEPAAQRIQEAGFWGYLVALPFGGLFAAWEGAEELDDPLSLDAFERAGSFRTQPTDEHEVQFGLLPTGTTRAQAACALTPRGQPCRRRLAVGRTVPAGDRFVRLAAIDTRFAVFVARQREDLELAPRHLTAAPVAPARVEVTEDALRAEEPTLAAMAPGRTVFELTSDGATLRTRARTVAAAAIPAARP